MKKDILGSALTLSAGARKTTGLTLSTKASKEAWQTHLNTAQQTLLTERARRRVALEQLAFALSMKDIIQPQTVASIGRAMKDFNNIDEHNATVSYDVLEMDYHSGPVGVGYIDKAHQQLYIRKGNTNETIDSFLVKHGAYAYSKKLRAVNDMITLTAAGIALDADINLDFDLIMSVDFINSSAFARYNATYDATLKKIAEHSVNSQEDTIEV